MYNLPPSPQYARAQYAYQPSPPETGRPPTASTSTSLQTLSHAALGHTNVHSLTQERPRPLLPAPAATVEPARGISSEAGGSMSPSAMREDDKEVKGAKGGTAKGKQTRKRGRKRIEEEVDPIEANDSLDADAKRKLQNRAAQRAFRERKERHVIDLEEKVVEQEAELAKCRELIKQLRIENKALRRGENPAPTPASSTMNGTSASPPDTKPVLEQRLSNGASPSFHHNILNDDVAPPPNPSAQFQTSPASPPRRLPPTSFAPIPQSPPHIDSILSETSTNLGDLDLTKLDSAFDFEAPFDFSESMALPPLFASLLDDLSLPPSTDTNLGDTPSSFSDPNRRSSTENDSEPLSSLSGVATDQTMDLDSTDRQVLEDEDDDPPPLPLGRIPCDKPECDFTAVSCALPIPWRPPNAPSGSEDKDLWIAQKCWAKLVSHPLFDRCDPDELCQELRDKTRCSDDGRLVCHKNDVCDIFRSIPQKVKLRQLLQE
ncbi:hypothetical protein JCM16303_004307 [Sporobolomyces ruberrimus]